MSEKPSSPRKKIMGLIGFVMIVVLAYFGGKSIGKIVGKNLNAAESV